MTHLFKVIIDFAKLNALDLNPNEYVYLYCRYHKLDKTIDDIGLTEHISVFPDFIEALEVKGYIDELGDGSVILRHKAIDLFEETQVDIKFYEFFGTYPLKVPNDSGGYRPLRPKEITAKQSVELKKLYVNIIKKEPGLHSKIMTGLNNYLKTYKHKLTYLVSIDKFVKEHMWELYEENTSSVENNFSIDV